MQRDEAYLLDILIEARKALKFIEGLTWEQFEQSELHQNAVIRPLEIIGKAARLVYTQTKDKHPDIPWKQMTGLRNRLIHEYSSIDFNTVWDTIKIDLPALISLVEPLVPPED